MVCCNSIETREYTFLHATPAPAPPAMLPSQGADPPKPPAAVRPALPLSRGCKSQSAIGGSVPDRPCEAFVSLEVQVCFQPWLIGATNQKMMPFASPSPFHHFCLCFKCAQSSPPVSVKSSCHATVRQAHTMLRRLHCRNAPACVRGPSCSIVSDTCTILFIWLRSEEFGFPCAKALDYKPQKVLSHPLQPTKSLSDAAASSAAMPPKNSAPGSSRPVTPRPQDTAANVTDSAVVNESSLGDGGASKAASSQPAPGQTYSRDASENV